MRKRFPERSSFTAMWLLAMAALTVLMVLVGGATRLTDSGLSITEWRPVTGAIPPLTEAAWAAEFERYRRIPEYLQVNAGMSLDEFRTIYWWEWGHRFLGRVIGLAFLLPFLGLLATRRIPERLIWPCVGLFVLGGLQGAVGWWMVSSGLNERVDVAPERLSVHLGLALALLCALLWAALDAWRGPSPALDRRGRSWSLALLGMIWMQCLLGGLVAGNDAGRIYTDWPRMGGRWFPVEYAGEGVWGTLAHSLAAVQLHHRIGGYLLLAAAAAWAWRARGRADGGPAVWVLLAVLAQAAMGVLTLVNGAPLPLAMLHQAGAVGVLAVATWAAWRSGRQVARVASNRAHGPVMAKVAPGA